MITSNRIEEFAFRGKCRWFVQWHGIGSAGTIPCPEGGFILLRQILYKPFINLHNPSIRTDSIEYVHQITLSEQGSQDELQYIFRDIYQDGTNTPNQNDQSIETWGVFKRNIEIDIINASNATFFNVTSGNFSPVAQERPTPLGFGVTESVQGDIALSSVLTNESYFPNGQKRPIAGLSYAGAGAGVRDRLRWDVTSSRVLFSPNGSLGDPNLQYPIVGFGMWIFNIPVSEYLNY